MSTFTVSHMKKEVTEVIGVAGFCLETGYVATGTIRPWNLCESGRGGNYTRHTRFPLDFG